MILCPSRLAQLRENWRRVGRYVAVAFVVASVALVFVPGLPVSAAVDISSFSAKVEGAAIRVTWRTATERGNTGFRLLRSTSNGGPWESKGEFWTTCPGCILGSNYSFTDNAVASGKTYYYKLESIDTGKQYGPVSVSFGAPATNPTATKTSTSGPALAASPTPTIRVSWTATRRPATGTATRSASVAPSQYGTVSPAARETPAPKIAYAAKESKTPSNSSVAQALPPTAAAESAPPVEPAIAQDVEENTSPESDTSEPSFPADNWRPVIRLAVYGLAGVLGLGACMFASLAIFLLARSNRRG